MKTIFLYGSFLGIIFAFPHPPDIEDEFSDLPFDTESFSSMLDQPAIKEDITKDEIFTKHMADETLQQRLKMKNMFMDRGPPSIMVDLFDGKHEDDNSVKDTGYDGSGVGVEENEIESDDIEENNTSPLNITENASPEVSNYSGENATSDILATTSSSNSSLLLDQNTSDVEVETISEDDLAQETKVIVAAELKTGTKRNESQEVLEKLSPLTTIIQSVSEKESSCPAPKLCAKNCFVHINEKGCQDCQCLWTASDCKVDQDCPDRNQYCDLNKCNCQPGYRQNMKKSGICEIDPNMSFNKLHFSESEKRQVNLKDIDKQISVGSQKSRTKRENKPRRAERLEWPGVCDRNEHCPDNLVCIHGDCWNVPEKSQKRFPAPEYQSIVLSGNSNTGEDNYHKVSFDTENVEHVPTSLVDNSNPLNNKGMTRFVSEDFAKQLQRTTAKVKRVNWFPPTTTAPTLFTSQTRYFPTESVPPLSVDRFLMIETTTISSSTTTMAPVKVLVDDHKMEHLKERKAKFFGIEADSLDFDVTTISPSHVKKIHLISHEPTFSGEQKKVKKRRTTTPVPDDASEIFENEQGDISEIDDVEFPISSMIRNRTVRAKALSAQPTHEELEDHEKLIDLFNSHSNFNSDVSNIESPTTPKEELLESFANGRAKPEIQLSLATEDSSPNFSPIPVLPSESSTEKRKPYIIGYRKFTSIAPLENISGDMATEDPPEITPEPAPFEQQIMGLWYPMRKGDIPHLGIYGGERRRAPQKKIRTADDLRLYNEYTKANRQNRPIRIEMDNARELMRNECQEDKNCGNLTICCTKRWCDRTNNCGTGKFCLPNCNSTKLTFLPSSSNSEGIIDIMYD